MQSIFQVKSSLPLFKPSGCVETTFQNINFYRSGVVSQTSAGDTILSFSFLGAFDVDIQPLGGNILRQIQGQVIKVSHRIFIEGLTILREKDRCVHDGYQLEIINVSRYGGELCEIDLHEIGR